MPARTGHCVQGSEAGEPAAGHQGVMTSWLGMTRLWLDPAACCGLQTHMLQEKRLPLPGVLALVLANDWAGGKGQVAWSCLWALRQ